MTEVYLTPCRDCRNLVFLVKFPSILQIMLWQQSFHLYLFRSKIRNLRLSCMLVITVFSMLSISLSPQTHFSYNINIPYNIQSYLIGLQLRPQQLVAFVIMLLWYNVDHLFMQWYNICATVSSETGYNRKDTRFCWSKVKTCFCTFFPHFKVCNLLFLTV